jgi:hypothetical protein
MTLGLLDILTYLVRISLIIMPETAASPSTRNRQSKQYRCRECGKPFDSAETLDSHQRFEHSEPGHSKPVAGVGGYKPQLQLLRDLMKYANSICLHQL